MTDQEISRQTTLYIKGKLTPDQVDELWVEYLKDSEQYECFLIELHLAAILRECKVEK